MIKEKANIAVFISGRGTNLKALILRSKKKKQGIIISNLLIGNFWDTKDARVSSRPSSSLKTGTIIDTASVSFL